jgi:D-serine deaminase-like pyridoxal phosphate-dependent protein
VNRDALDRATAGLEPPFAVVDLDAFDANAADLLRRAGATALRLASKSVRCRALQRRALDAGFRGQLCFTLPEALWLAEHGFDDLVVAYPTADRTALRELGDGPHRATIAVMVDSRAHLDLVASCGGARVCLDVDAGWWLAGGRIRIGVKRSPLHTPQQAVALAAMRSRGPGSSCRADVLRGAHRGRRGRARGATRLRRGDPRHAAGQRARAGSAPRRGRGGGAGHRRPAVRQRRRHGVGRAHRGEAAVTEVDGGLGALRADALRSLPRVHPAAGRAVRSARRAQAIAGRRHRARRRVPRLGVGGRRSAAAPGAARGAAAGPHGGRGEVQTPVLGPAARDLALGDRVWFRHAKAGELCERFASLHLVRGGDIVDQVPTYRGEGRAFL